MCRWREASYFVWKELEWLLQVDNSSLTGESEPQARSPEFTHEVCQFVKLLRFSPRISTSEFLFPSWIHPWSLTFIYHPDHFNFNSCLALICWGHSLKASLKMFFSFPTYCFASEPPRNEEPCLLLNERSWGNRSGHGRQHRWQHCHGQVGQWHLYFHWEFFHIH